MKAKYDGGPARRRRRRAASLVTTLGNEEKIKIICNILENDKQENEMRHFAKFIYQSERKRFENVRK